MAKSQNFKQVVVREDAKTSLRSAKIHPLQLAHGVKISGLAHLEYPYHDRAMFDEWIKMLEVEKPGVVFLQGAIVSEVAFRSLDCFNKEDNYLHDHPEVPEVEEALEAGLYEDTVFHLAKREGKCLRTHREGNRWTGCLDSLLDPPVHGQRGATDGNDSVHQA